MSMRAGGDPLTSVVPELERLATNPREYLTEGPLLFGPRRFFGLTVLFGLPGLLFLVLWQQGIAETDGLAMGIALLIGAGIWLVYSIATAGHSLYLGPEGVEIRYLDTTVYCPWDLFDVNGEPWSGGKDSPSAGLAVPVASAIVPMVVWRRGVIELARGAGIRAPQAWFVSPSELILPGRYELNSEDLGKLLMLLGAKLSGRLSTRSLAEQSDAYATRDRATNTLMPATSGSNPADDDGYYTVSLARFRLPPCCVVCAREPETTLVLTLRAGSAITFEMPICHKCRGIEVGKANRTIAGWTGGLSFFGMIGGIFAPGGVRSGAMIAGSIFGMLLGMVVGSLVGVPHPIEIRNFNEATGTMRIRFVSEAVERKYREMQAHS